MPDTKIGPKRELEVKRAIEVKKLIREQRLQGQENRLVEMERRRDMARQEFEERLKEEAIKSNECEQKVADLERYFNDFLQHDLRICFFFVLLSIIEKCDN